MTTQRIRGETRIALAALALVLLLPAVASVGPALLALAPAGLTNQNPVTLIVTTDQNATCKFDPVQTQFDLMAYTLYAEGMRHKYSMAFADGVNSVYAACRNSSNATSDTASISFTLDTVAPVLSDLRPSGLLSDPALALSLTTNEDATCKYGLQDQPFNLMPNTFANTGSRTHSQSMTLPQGSHDYRVLCSDEAGNSQTTAAKFIFSINLKPTASISISHDDPIKAGMYDVHVTTSEDVQYSPTLTYNFHDDGNMRAVSLMGSGTTWDGYLVIADENRDRIGTFFFNGVDKTGLAGTEITGGRLFIVDTKKPDTPLGLEIKEARQGLQLSWTYEGEDLRSFRIYRSEIGGVEKSDYLANTDEDTYLDRTVAKGGTYHYRISAVDTAGNEGELSGERWWLVADAGADRQAVQQVQRSTMDPMRVSRVNDGLRNLEKDRLDIEGAKYAIDSASDQAQIDVIAQLSLNTKVQTALSQMQTAIDGLTSLLESDLTDAEFEKQYTRTMLTADEARKGVVYKIVIKDKYDGLQTLSESDYMEPVSAVVASLQYTNKQKEEYLGAVKDIQDGITVTLRIVTAEIHSLGGAPASTITLVRKTVTSSTPVADAWIMETIPKSVAKSADDISFGQAPIVVKKDSMVKWTIPSLTTHSILYSLPGAVDMTSLKASRTIVLTPPDEYASAGPESITGNVVKEAGKTPLSLSTLLVILGTLAVVGLGTYYFFFLKSEQETAETPQSEQAVFLPSARRSGGTHHVIMHRDRQAPSASQEVRLDEQIKRAHHAIDSLDFATGDRIYQRLVESQDSSTPSTEIDDAISGLYVKLLALSVIKEGHEGIDRADHDLVLQKMAALQDLMPLVDEATEGRTALLAYASKSLGYFQQWYFGR
ncbi:MAG: hypothetical protein ABIH41_03525 [Nanoarchaeota archaeon]